MVPLGLMCPILLPISSICWLAGTLSVSSVNQRLPSDPAAMSFSWLIPVGRGNWVMVPLGLMGPILLPISSGVLVPNPLKFVSVNQRLPSGPAAMSFGWLLAVGTGNSVMVPLGLMRPIWLPPCSVNQRLLSGPAVIP